jgi:hypothetical protein
VQLKATLDGAVAAFTKDQDLVFLVFLAPADKSSVA